jgi:uncharacterized protein with HEPN domain
MAASCMLMESIGEGVKKLDWIIPNFLVDNAPNVPWNSVMGLRNHIAHGYFNLDSEIIYDIAIHEIPLLRETFLNLIPILEGDLGQYPHWRNDSSCFMLKALDAVIKRN